MKISEVNNLQTEKDFLNLPFSIYKNDKNWVCPLLQDIKNVFDPLENNHFNKNGKAKRWIIYNDNKCVGRIAAFFHLHHDELMAGIGFFECVNNQSIANQLFDIAENWLKENKVKNIEAPISFGARDSFWGLLVEGNEHRPSYRENYNPVYYKALFENYGFEKEFEQTTALIIKDNFNYERFGRLAQRSLNNPIYTFEYLDWSNINKYVADFETIYNKAWKNHDFFEPVKVESLQHNFKEMKPVAPGPYNIFVYANGEPVGFYLNLLDINQYFQQLKGKLNLISKIKLLLFRKKIDRIRGVIFGVIPEYQNRGLEIAMIIKMKESLDKNPQIKGVELAWVGDFNPKMLSMFKSMGAIDYKKHYTFSKNIFLYNK